MHIYVWPLETALVSLSRLVGGVCLLVLVLALVGV